MRLQIGMRYLNNQSVHEENVRKLSVFGRESRKRLSIMAYLIKKGGKMKVTLKNIKEKGMEILFLFCACISILSVALICIFLFSNGIPGISEIGFRNFIFGKNWKPGSHLYGIFSMILGSIYITAGAIIVGVPIGLLTAIFMAEFCPKWLYKILKPGVELLAGIPSVVYGFFGLCVLVPFFRENLRPVLQKYEMTTTGQSILTASLLLGMMILPTIINVSESAIRAVPEKYYQGALALGATHERSVFKTVVPAAKSGIMAAIILGVGRAIGETMAVIMVAGNQPRVPGSVFDGVRTMTANIVIDMGYATDLHREALIATGVVLFVFILIINMLFSMIKRKEAKV